jgi:hypothetical protein
LTAINGSAPPIPQKRREGERAMGEQQDVGGRVIMFGRPWHVIQEIDLVRLLAGHERRAATCDRLEELADALPERPSPNAARHLCAALSASIERSEHDEDRLLLAMFERDAGDRLNRALLARIRVAHATDAAYLHELVAALDPEAADHRPLTADALAYLLRCCFTSCRQTMAFEELAILKLAERRLAPAAREMLVNRLARRAVN